MGKLEIRVLGTLSVAGEGAAEFTLTRKNKSVLAALALAGPEGLSRQKLVDLFWRDQGEEQGRASLRQALAATRKGLGSHRDCLLATPDRIRIDGAMVEIDAREFEALASSEASEDRDRALALYQGDLLDGVSVKEEGFEVWLRPSRERLRAQAIALLSKGLEDDRDEARCATLAARLLELEPMSEAAHRALMRVYAAQGRDNAALKQFLVCRDLLDRELGVGPSRETIVLHEEIRARRRLPARAAPGGGDRIASGAPTATTGARARPTIKPTITVIAFENLSEEPGQDHFAAGISHDIVSALLRHRWLSVISPASMLRTGRYSIVADGRVIEANVDYMVTGSVRKAGERLRIGVQMVEAGSGEHIWSENYDRRLDDIFLVQDEITGTIAGHIHGEVGASERRRVLRKSTRNMGAWDCYHLGMAHYFKFTNDDHVEARRLFARSLEFDPEFGEGHAWWSYMNVLATFYFDAEPTEALFVRALIAAKRAVEIDDQNAMFHMLVARVHLARREYAEGLAELDIALDLNPNLAGVYCGMGDALSYEGKYEQAIGQFEKSLQLGPRDPVRWAYLGYGAMAHLFAENFEMVLDWSDKAIRYPRCQYWAHAHRVAALGHLGRSDEARDGAAELVRRQPRFSRRLAEKKLYFIKRPEQLLLYLDGLRKAGLPE